MKSQDKDANYSHTQWLADLKQRIQSAQVRAVRFADCELIHIGRISGAATESGRPTLRAGIGLWVRVVTVGFGSDWLPCMSMYLREEYEIYAA